MPNQYRPGRHELGQNFLRDRDVIARVTSLVAERPGPIVEWGTGDGALTHALANLGRPIEGIEIDHTKAEALDRKTGPHVCIGHGDILRHAPPTGATVISNIPFHLTTPVLRHLLTESAWSHAVLITQWEVARKRAAVGGATQMTSQWWPWYTFALDQRVPAHAFKPRPSVDAGILLIDRRQQPLLETIERRDYQAWVAAVFQGRGGNLTEILTRQGVPTPIAKRIVARCTKRRGPTLPKHLLAEDWVHAFHSRSDH